VPIETRVFMLVERWRSSRRNARWNCPPTQNCTGVVKSHRSHGLRSQAGVHGKRSGIPPRSTGSDRTAPTTSFTCRREISRVRSACSRARLAGVTATSSGIA
jgi:hypothetical protein